MRALEFQNETSVRKEQDKLSMAMESNSEALLRKEQEKVHKAKKRALETDSEALLRKEHEKLKLVKAVQDFSAGCSTSIEPQNDMLFIK